MKKWKTPTASGTAGYWSGVAPDDPNIWTDVYNLIPANGAYVVPDGYVTAGGASVIAATGETASSVKYAFAGETPTGIRGYVVGNKIWEHSVPYTLTDRTGVFAGGLDYPYMAQYGTATIAVFGNTRSTAYSVGGNFLVLADAPKGEIVVTCSNAVLIFNGDKGTLYNDGWWASDVGDYTNWTTGEAASGRLIQTPGKIVAAVAFKDCVYAFKSSSIYRGRYVGGEVKWVWEVVDWTIGIDDAFANNTVLRKYAITACKDGVAFASFMYPNTAPAPCIRLFDGANPPAILNPETVLTLPAQPFFHYDPRANRLWITGGGATDHLCYSFNDDAWGNATSNAGAVAAPYMGSWAPAHYERPIATRLSRWVGGTDTLTMWYSEPAKSMTTAITSYVQTHKIGKWDLKTGVKRATPVLRSKTNRTGGTPLMSMTYSLFTERHDLTARSGPTAVTKSTTRDRFDWTASDTYHQIKMTFADMDIAIDEIDVKAVTAGTD